MRESRVAGVDGKKFQKVRAYRKRGVLVAGQWKRYKSFRGDQPLALYFSLRKQLREFRRGAGRVCVPPATDHSELRPQPRVSFPRCVDPKGRVHFAGTPSISRAHAAVCEVVTDSVTPFGQ